MRLVVAGLTMVTLAGLIIDLRGRVAEVALEAVVLAFVVMIVLLTSRWWDPTGKPTSRPRVRVFVGLAGLAVLAQLLGLAVDPADVSVNLVPLLLVGVLFLNSFG